MRQQTARPFKSAFVLGSTSAVARVICLELARHGCSCFHLVARDPLKNQQLAEELMDRFGAVVSVEQFDLFGDLSLDMANQLPSRDFDLYLITAGSLGNPELARSDAMEAFRITAANYWGLLPWITAIATSDRISRPGSLWVFTSVAADRGRPTNYHYGAAKAALTTLLEGLFLRCHGQPFAVRIIKAGFIATPMTVSMAPAALCASLDSVVRDLMRNPQKRGIEYLPWWWSPLMFLIRLLPAPLASKL